MSATVFSLVRRASGVSYAECRMQFRPYQAPYFKSDYVVPDDDVVLETDASGFFSQELASGYYWVWIANSRPFSIFVPDTDLTYLLNDLRTGGSGLATSLQLGGSGDNYRFTDGVLELINGTDGGWHPIWIIGIDSAYSVAIGDETSGIEDNHRVVLSSLQLLHWGDGTWHALWVTGSDPAFTEAIGGAGVTTANYRVSGGRLQFKNLGDGNYHTMYVVGAAGEQLAIGPGEA
jgi:hypothetical protein